jgi:hypothetical protein
VFSYSRFEGHREKVMKKNGLIGGIEKKEIKIVNYDPNWVPLFHLHEKRI